MTDSYAERRRQYVADIRQSFANEEELESYMDVPAKTLLPFAAKLRLLIAAFLFVAFLYCQYTDTELFGYTTEQVMEQITDNQYYTNAKNYVMIQEQKFLKNDEKGFFE